MFVTVLAKAIHFAIPWLCNTNYTAFRLFTNKKAVEIKSPSGRLDSPAFMFVHNQFVTHHSYLLIVGAPRIELGPLGPKPRTLPLCYAPS